MISKFVEFVNENYKTGVFNYKGMTFKLDVKMKNNLTNVKILYKNSLYNNLSVDIPESEKLDSDEFYLNPKVDKELVNMLVDQGFIEESGKEKMAGDEKTKSYKLV
jgi:hypothetical protein